MYKKFIYETNKEFSTYVESISNVLPYEYDGETIINLIKEFYPFEYQIFDERYRGYVKHDNSLKKIKHKIRFNMAKPNRIILNLDISRKLLDDEYRKEYNRNFNNEIMKKNLEILHEERDPKINKIKSKVDKAKLKTQQMKPDYLDKLIGLYDRKGTTQKDRVYIIHELQKYYSPKIVNFFQRKIHSEYNYQLRYMAFLHHS